MGVTKTEAFSIEQNELARLAKALGHPARIAILQQLLRLNCCVGVDFTREIELSQPTISKHLRELKEVGLIQGTVEGTSISYCIDSTRWREVQKILGALFAQLEGGEANCC
ncbi:MAG: metalloregulator ArsR/SmtB family transcription factor [Bacteroidota bacterium]